MKGILTSSDSSSPFLPEDAILYILGKADNASLCRYRVLNKYWCSSLKEYKFLSHRYLTFATNKQTLLLHIWFSQWRNDNNAIVSVNALTGAANTLSLPTQLTKCSDFTLVGSELGNLCLTFTDGCRKNMVLIWNILTSSVRQLPQPCSFKAHTCVSIFAFTYYPSTTDYCVVHAFKQKFEDKNIWYTLWNSKYQQWEPKKVANGDTTNLGLDYVSLNGLVFWINFSGLNLDQPESVVVFFICNYSWGNIQILKKAKSDCNALVLLRNKICYMSYPANIDHYTISLWFLERKREDCFWWNPLYTLESFRMYEQPKVFLDDKIISLTQEGIQGEIFTKEIVLSRCSWGPYQRRHLYCQSWPIEIQVKKINLHMSGLFLV